MLRHRPVEPARAELARPLMAAGDGEDDHARPPPPVRTPPRFSRATKAIIAFYLLVWVAFTILLWLNQRISAEEAIKLAEKYRRANEDVYVRTNVVFGADGAVLHDGECIISLHTVPDGRNVTTASRGSREAWM